jgi:hypothetical protein
VIPDVLQVQKLLHRKADSQRQGEKKDEKIQLKQSNSINNVFIFDL